MTYVFALIKKEWFRLLDSPEIKGIDVRIPDLKTDYQPTHILQDEEWFMLKEFNEKEFSNKLCKTPNNTVDYNSSDAVPSIKAVAFIQEVVVDSQEEVVDSQKEEVAPQKKEIIGFQRITSTKVISNKSFLSLRGEASIHDFKGVILDHDMDAVFDKQENILYFRDLKKLNSIFPGIKILHRKADNIEVTNFLNVTCASLCELDIGFPIDDIKKTDRKNIAQLIDKKTIESLSNDQKERCVKYCNEYLEIEKKGDKFLIKNEAEVTELIKALSEKFYVTSIRGETREVTSYKTIEKRETRETRKVTSYKKIEQ